MRQKITEWDLFLRSDIILDYLIERDSKDGKDKRG